MDLSIIIVNWNTKNLLISCIDSIVTSKPKVSYEIIVVDNGSSDGSIAALLRQGHVGRDAIIRNKKNLGFAKANNQGIRKAKGKYILLLNSDTKVKKGTLDSLVEFASKTKDAGVIGAKLLNKDGTSQPSVFRFPKIKRAINQYWFGNGDILDKYYPDSEESQAVEAIVGAAFLITPSARKKVGLLNEKYFMYFEDIEYCRKVKKAGLRVYYLPSAEIYHYHGASGKKLEPSKNQWRRLIPSSKLYHGILGHYLFNFILWSGQKLRKIG